MPDRQTWVVIGATGFVGSAICRELDRRGISATPLVAPRVRLRGPRTADNIARHLDEDRQLISALSEAMRGTDVVINAAGLALPDSGDTDELFGANALLPALIAEAAGEVGGLRLVHLSSVAALGRDAPLHDRPETQPFSPYSESKALAETILLSGRPGQVDVCVVRATSVHGPGRATTAKLQRLARSPFASVASPGNQPSPVSSVRGLADFVVDLGQASNDPPVIALQPWEGATTSSVLRMASGRNPKVLPRWLCSSIVKAGWRGSHLAGGRFDGAVRRLELMWFGQGIDTSWVSSGRTGHLQEALRPPGTGRPKIGMLTQWYDPETGPAALPGVYARAMQRSGHDVDILTGFPNYPDGQIYTGYKQTWRKVELLDGARVTRVPLYPSHDASAVGRAANYLSFALSATLFGGFALRRCRVVWVYSSPVSISLPLLFHTRLGRKPYFLHVQDLWPDSLLNSGMIPGGIIGRIASSIVTSVVKLTERRARVVGVISPSVRDLILERNPRLRPEAVVYVPNPTDEDLFRDIRQLSLDKLPDVPWRNRFTFMYTGAMGEMQGLDVVLDAANRCRARADIAIAFVGDGIARERLEARAKKEGLDNVIFYGRVDKQDVPAIMATSNVQLVSLASNFFLKMTTPSKIPSIMASAIPILAQIDGDGALLIERSGAGTAITPGDAEALAKAMMGLADAPPAELDAMAQAGLQYYREHLSAASAVETILTALGVSDIENEQTPQIDHDDRLEDR